MKVTTMPRARKTHCQRNHEFTPENTMLGADGCRRCRACQDLSQMIRVRPAYRLRSDTKQMTVECPGCGDQRSVLARQARRIRNGENTGLCERCRAPEVTPLREENLHEFWTDRFSQDEIDDLWASVSLYLDLPEELAA